MTDTLNWEQLSKTIVANSSKILFEPNKQYFTKVAFDVWQANNSNVESLWVLEDGEDGKQYLVARYSDEDSNKSLESKSNWSALSDKTAQNVTLIYKDTPIQRFASSDFGFTKENVNIFKKLLVEKLNSDKSFVNSLLTNQSQEKQEYIVAQFPELLNKMD